MGLLWAALVTACMPAWAGHDAVAPANSATATAPAPPVQVLELPARPGPANFDTGSVTFIGNATVLIRYGNFTILTDPNFLHRGEQVHLGYGLTATRLTDPAITLDNLPPIDLVVLSHMHGDHFDQLVQERLDRTIPIVTTPAAAAALGDLQFQSRYALTRWQTLLVKKGTATLRITSMPARHGPPLLAAMMPQTMGSLLEFGPSPTQVSYRVYISGDTLMFRDIGEIAHRYPDIDLALLHLGGTTLLNTVMVTMDGEQGADMLRVIAPAKAIPIHYDDYDVFKSPIAEFERAVRSAGLESKVVYLKHGASYNFRGRRAQDAP